jgi:hypothetical protein
MKQADLPGRDPRRSVSPVAPDYQEVGDRHDYEGQKDQQEADSPYARED